MKRVLTSSNRFLMRGGRWLTREYVPPEPPPEIRYVHLNQTTGGTISASPMSGVDGDTVTLSNSPSTNYTFNGYSVNGATLYSGNKFDFSGSDVTCSASWITSIPTYTIRLKYVDGVSPTFSKGTGVQVSSSPNIWDLTYQNSDWSQLLKDQHNLIEVIHANSTGVTNMASMFNGCYSLTTVPAFDTSSVTDMSYMFYGNNQLSSIQLIDTSKVTNMSHMFHACNVIRSIPTFNTSNATDMSYMFFACGLLETVPLLDTSSVNNMQNMFNACTSLTSVPLFDTSLATDMSYMFNGCSSLISVPLLDTSSVTTMYRMFYSCRNVQSGALALYQQASTQTTPPSNHNRTFYQCGSNTVTGAAELAQIPSDWK